MRDNVKDQLNRMKGLMTYGLQTENKTPYASVEFSKKGADGTLYGIIREGNKYYIKSCDGGKKGLVKEDYSYIGGFRNRKDYEYTSYANALKQFDLKMASLREANDPQKKVVIESWNPDKQEMLTVEATDKMRKEIARQRQIMGNVSRISEGKDCPQCGVGGNPFTIDAEKYFEDLPKTDNEKTNINKPKDEAPKERKSKGGKVKANEGKLGKAITNEEKVCKKCGKPCGKCNCDECGDMPELEEEVLGWNDNYEYMDKSHGTKIGDSAPFDSKTARNIDDKKGPVTDTEPDMKNGVVESYHGTAMHTSQNQNSPEVGTKGRGGAKKVDEPFDDSNKEVNEEIEDFGDDIEDDDVDLNDDFEGEDDNDFGGEEEFGADDELGGDEDFDEPVEDEEDTAIEVEPDGIEDRLNKLEDLIGKIADKLGVDEFQDEELYPDEEEDDDDEDFDEDEDDFEDDEDDFEDEDEEDDDDDEIFESRSYRNMKLREANDKEWKERFDKLFGGNPFDEKGCKELGLDAEELYGGKKKKTKKSKKNGENTKESVRRNGSLVSEAGQKPIRSLKRLPKGNMNPLDDFGKHPAYQKTVMSLPPKDHKEFPGYYDMNDDSVKNDQPYGNNIGDGAPFEVDIEEIQNTIAESIKRHLGIKGRAAKKKR